MMFTDSKEELEKLYLDNEGNICDPSVKIFSGSVIESKKYAAREKKENKKIRKETKIANQKRIASEASLFDDNPLSPKMRKNDDKPDPEKENTVTAAKDVDNSSRKVFEKSNDGSSPLDFCNAFPGKIFYRIFVLTGCH